MAFKLSKTEALTIQAKHVDHYANIYGEWVREAVALETRADELPEGEHDVVIVNRYIPRGGMIEHIIEKRGYKTQLSSN